MHLEQASDLRSATSVGKEPTSTVLVVDDEEHNRLLLRDPLENRGYRIIEARDGAEALQCVVKELPDVILLDVMMPGMDGFEVCRRLKSNHQTAPIPILMVTALSERQERLLGIQAGANDFLNKPVDIHDLTIRVKNALYTKSLFDQLKLAQQKSEDLLRNILPKTICDRINNGETLIADHHPDVTVLVADLAGFTTLIAQISPRQIVLLLNEIFSAFDLLVEQLKLEKIKTMGDAYMVAGGINSASLNPIKAIAELAIKMQTTISSFNVQYGTSIRMRIGISTGSLISGVIGRTKLGYDVWGNAVNLACHLQAAAPAGGILVDDATCRRLEGTHRFSGGRSIELKNHSTVTVRTLAPLPAHAEDGVKVLI
jgi:adenylate cyclase